MAIAHAYPILYCLNAALSDTHNQSDTGMTRASTCHQVSQVEYLEGPDNTKGNYQIRDRF